MAQINAATYFFEKSSIGGGFFKMIIKSASPVAIIDAGVFSAFGLDSGTSALSIWNNDYEYQGTLWKKDFGETHFTPNAIPAEWADINDFQAVVTQLGNAITAGMTQAETDFAAQSGIDQAAIDAFGFLIGD